MSDYNENSIWPSFHKDQGQDVECDWYPAEEAPIEVRGLAFFHENKKYYRYPENPPEPLTPGIIGNAKGPSGGQLCFSANASLVKVRVEFTKVPVMTYNVPPLAAMGLDVYVSKGEGKYAMIGVSCFNVGNDRYETVPVYWGTPRKLDYIINLPIRAEIKRIWIGIPKGEEILPPPPLENKSRILIYGGSIMHGYCATRPGMTMPNILSRRLKREVINLGVSGAAKCEREAALAVRMVDNVSILIISAEGNCPSVEHIYEHLPEFIRLFREVYPDIPIVLMSYMREGREYLKTGYTAGRRAKKDCLIRITEEMRAAGDKNIHFWDGEEFTEGEEDIVFEGFSAGEDCTVDTQHKSDLGFWLMANGMMRRMRELEF